MARTQLDLSKLLAAVSKEALLVDFAHGTRRCSGSAGSAVVRFRCFGGTQCRF